ncbi:hypothetical protein R4144_09535 [Gordonia amicalis]|uniref:hypothetical protein n=1 Tax=Gordonia amicalis TaxID=89053 RepID=UPI0029555393|nr:hypothetical protein [Gordonia amicalis]MDV7173617.1 hypothetical protein [Gordonia amicalis]
MGRRSHSSESAWGPEHAERIREDLHESWRWLKRRCAALLGELESLDGPLCGEHIARRSRLARARSRLDLTLTNSVHATLTLPHEPLIWVRESAIPVLASASQSYHPSELLEILNSARRDEVGFVLFETSVGSHRIDDTISGPSAREVSIDGLYWYPANVTIRESPDETHDGVAFHVLSRHRGLRRAHASESYRPLIVVAEAAIFLLTPIGVRASGDSRPVRLLAALVDEVGLGGSPSLRVELLDRKTAIVSAA